MAASVYETAGSSALVSRAVGVGAISSTADSMGGMTVAFMKEKVGSSPLTSCVAGTSYDSAWESGEGVASDAFFPDGPDFASAPMHTGQGCWPAASASSADRARAPCMPEQSGTAW